MTKPEKNKAQRERDVNLTFRVSAKEHEMIKKRMEQCGYVNMRAYILKMSLAGRIIHIELDSVNEMVRLLSNATNNINQIARRANETGSIYASDMDKIRSRNEEIWTQTQEILRRLTVLQ